MNACLETIKVQNRQLYQLSYHNERMNRSRRALFGCTEEIDLQRIISIPTNVDERVYKCRVIYDTVIHSIEFTPYQIKPIHTLQLVEANELNYAHKYLDRSAFAHLLADTTADDILIVKNGFITDTSYANVVFWDGERWITPANPLLYGTKRQYLLDIQRIESKILRPTDLPCFTHAKLINAMLDLNTGPVIPVENIL